jgi:hypothetical protein
VLWLARRIHGPDPAPGLVAGGEVGMREERELGRRLALQIGLLFAPGQR